LVTLRLATGVTVVVTELVLLFPSTSPFSEAAVAVLVIDKVLPILAVRVNSALPSGDKELMVQPTVPLPPVGGVLQLLAIGPLS